MEDTQRRQSIAHDKICHLKLESEYNRHAADHNNSAALFMPPRSVKFEVAVEQGVKAALQSVSLAGFMSKLFRRDQRGICEHHEPHNRPNDKEGTMVV